MPEPAERPELSVILPLYNEAENITPLVTELVPVLSRLGRPWEIVLVDDGSLDGSDAVLRAQAAADPRIRVVLLRRNFGQSAAIAAGFDQSRGRILITMDADLQNDPADIPALLDGLAAGHDIVSGWRRERQDPFLTRIVPSLLANRLISAITGVRLHDYGCTLKAYRREVVADLHLYGEMHRFLPALASWGGCTIREIPVHHRPRQRGRSKYGLGRTFKVILDLLTVKFLGSFGTKPIYVFGGAGILCLVAAFFTVGALLYRKFVLHEYMIQSPLLLLSVLLVILGVQSTFLGLLAEMMVRTYYETQRKPVYRVKEILNDPEPPCRTMALETPDPPDPPEPP